MHSGTGFQIVSPPPTGRSAIAMIDVRGDVAGVLGRLGAADVPVGGSAVRNLGGLDRALVVRWSERWATLMPHASPLVVERLAAKLAELGCEASSAVPAQAYPEATDAVQGWMLEALSHAASPLAIDLLLDQPRRWHGRDLAAIDADIVQRSNVLARLLRPALVVAVGPPNIGKSTLLNALAGRSAAAVADAPGTTRDHVGVTLELAGLVVHWVDTPGIAADRGDAIVAAGVEIAVEVARRADLLVVCSDSTAAAPELPLLDGVPSLRVGLRCDLGESRTAVNCNVSVASRQGLEALVSTVREALVPAKVLGDPGPWKFWQEPRIPAATLPNIAPYGSGTTSNANRGRSGSD